MCAALDNIDRAKDLLALAALVFTQPQTPDGLVFTSDSAAGLALLLDDCREKLASARQALSSGPA